MNKMESLRIYFATWNVGTSNPEQDLHELLSLSHNLKNDKLLPDFYVISLQEVKAQPQNMLMAALFDDPWTNACRDILEARDFVKLKTIRLQGLVLSVYSLRNHLLNIREIEAEYTRTGLSGMWGNKGAVSVRLSIYGCSICFVNAHLSAHDTQLKDRVEDYNSIIKGQEFHVAETSSIFFHDYVFWMGDLNFRLCEDCEKTPEEIENSVKKGEIQELFKYDQLRRVMRSGEAFSELVENDPKFPPTFKFEVGTINYDYKRRPAWTDRILYKVNSDNYENVTLRVDQKSYRSLPNYLLSDHKPVTADFVIKIPVLKLMDIKRGPVDQVFSDYSENVIQFDKIPFWLQDEENTVSYKVTQDFPRTKEDWIGVFKENFSSLDEYIVYTYVHKNSSPTPDTRSPHRSACTVKSGSKYTITFPELPSRLSGNFRLIYFSQTEDNVQSVLGISDPFHLKEK